MKVQFDTADDTSRARVFRNNGTMLFELNDCDTDSRDEVDDTLKLIGWRRRTKWQRTTWGYEASVRRITGK